MRGAIKITIIGVILALALVGTYIYVNTPNVEAKVLSPISKTFSIFSFGKAQEPPNKIIYGYLPYWSITDAKYLQYDKLTDISYFGLRIDARGNFVKLNELGELEPGYNNWKNNKELDKIIAESKKNGVRFSFTVISHVDDVSDQFLDCRGCWDTLKNNIVSELLEKGITDVNLNFEYVEFTPKEKAIKYSQLTEYLNSELDALFGDSRVVVASFADSLVKERVTDISTLSKVADYIFIMAYDFHRPTSDITGPVAPLGGKGVHAEYDIYSMISDYKSAAPPGKLLMGVPYYGYNWVIKDDEKYAKRLEGNDEIGFSQSQTYEQIMETILKVKPELKWDDLGQTPYFSYTSPETGSLREIHYENAESLSFKYDLINREGLGGVGIWALGYDAGYNELWNTLARFFIE